MSSSVKVPSLWRHAEGLTATVCEVRHRYLGPDQWETVVVYTDGNPDGDPFEVFERPIAVFLERFTFIKDGL
jgi:hypothetical protein